MPAATAVAVHGVLDAVAQQTSGGDGGEEEVEVVRKQRTAGVTEGEDHEVTTYSMMLADH